MVTYLVMRLQNLLHCCNTVSSERGKNQKNFVVLETDPESYSMDLCSCSIPCLLKLFQIDSCFQQLPERSCLVGFYHGKNRFYLGYKLFNRRSNMILEIAL